MPELAYHIEQKSANQACKGTCCASLSHCRLAASDHGTASWLASGQMLRRPQTPRGWHAADVAQGAPPAAAMRPLWRCDAHVSRKMCSSSRYAMAATRAQGCPRIHFPAARSDRDGVSVHARTWLSTQSSHSAVHQLLARLLHGVARGKGAVSKAEGKAGTWLCAACWSSSKTGANSAPSVHLQLQWLGPQPARQSALAAAPTASGPASTGLRSRQRAVSFWCCKTTFCPRTDE